MAKRRRRKQKDRDRATGKNKPVHHEAAPEQTTTEASPTSAAQNPKTPQADQPAPKAGPRPDSAITDPEPTTTSTAAPGGSMVEVKDKPDWEVTPYRPPTVTRAKTRMQLGEWEQLAELDGNEVIGGAPVTELQLMAAVGHLQKGGENARDRARALLLEAMDTGADRKQIARMLIAGASNTLGRLAALTGRSDQKVLEHFRSAISISDPEADVDLMLHPMAARQLGRLATDTGSRKIQEMAQRAAMSVAFAESDSAEETEPKENTAAPFHERMHKEIQDPQKTKSYLYPHNVQLEGIQQQLTKATQTSEKYKNMLNEMANKHSLLQEENKHLRSENAELNIRQALFEEEINKAEAQIEQIMKLACEEEIATKDPKRKK